MRAGSRLVLFSSLAAVAAMGACGGSSNPAGPSSAAGTVTLQGVVLSGAAGASSLPGEVVAHDGSSGRITVTVQENVSISTTVSVNGTFTLDGLPATGFTLVFSSNGVALGTITITPVQGSSEIKIVVQVTTTTVILVKLDLGDEQGNSGGSNGGGTCMIEGGRAGRQIELEGIVAAGSASAFTLRVNGNRSSDTVNVAANGAQFKCNGKPSSASCQSNLKAGAQVHVKGVLTSCSATAATVTATEVMIQKEAGEDD